MEPFDVWDGVLLVIAGYVAVITLVRMMSVRRQQLSDDLYRQIQAEQERKQREAKRKKRQEAQQQQQEAG